jgi:hypothetical protein
MIPSVDYGANVLKSGLKLEYLFEIIVISVSWLVLVSGAFLSGKLYRKNYQEVIKNQQTR